MRLYDDEAGQQQPVEHQEYPTDDGRRERALGQAEDEEDEAEEGRNGGDAGCLGARHRASALLLVDPPASGCWGLVGRRGGVAIRYHCDISLVRGPARRTPRVREERRAVARVVPSASSGSGRERLCSTV